MMPFMSSKFMGDAFELEYKKIYLGGGDYGIIALRLVHMLGLLADANMITNMTRKSMEAFLTKDINLSDMEIISRHSNNVVLINKDIHEQESFNLIEYITWITEQLCKDPIMKKALCGRENYEGVKRVLNSYMDQEAKSVIKSDWIDFYICDDKVVYTKKDEEGIYLYVKENCTDDLPFSRKELNNVLLIQDKLLDGRIYPLADDTVFVQTDNGSISRIKGILNGKKNCTKIRGIIINQLEGGNLVYTDNYKLIELKTNGRKKVIVDNVHRGMISIEGNKVFWKSCFRMIDLEKSRRYFGDEYADEVVKPRIKAERISKEMLWKGLLFTLYDFDNMEFNNKIGNRLRFALFFDNIPVPFGIDEISRRLSEIEQYCYSNEVIKTDGYLEAMSFLMSIENKMFDEKQTIDSLIYLLDKVAANPYELIASNTSLEVMTCYDFMFGDLNEIDERSIIDDDMEITLSDISNLDKVDIDAMIRS